jgi:hypothetical protein
MNDHAMTRLEQRIAGLELANRRWRRLAAGSAIGLACLGVMGAQGSKVMKADQIEAQRVIVRDPAGHQLITLGMVDNYPAMRFQYPGSGSRATYFTGADHSTIALMDNNGASSITINSGGAQSQPDISIVRVSPGPKVQRLFRAP